MAKRIVEDLLDTGDVRYRVETNDGLFGWFYKRFDIWKTDHFTVSDGLEVYAVFETLKEAQKYCSKGPIVLESRVIEVYI
jgi:hypothetical protein